MPRFAQADWLSLGLEVIAQEGPSGLTIERLCQRARRTRGSFYHHFGDQQLYLEALVEEWRRVYALDPIKTSQRGTTPKRRWLSQLASQLDPPIEVGFRRLASQNPRVRRQVEAVDAERLRYLALLYREAGLSRANAERMAKLEYAAYVGALILWPETSASESEELGRLLSRLMASYF